MALQEGSVPGCCLGLPQRADSVIVVITGYILFSGRGEISRKSGASALKVPQLDARTDDWLEDPRGSQYRPGNHPRQNYGC